MNDGISTQFGAVLVVYDDDSWLGLTLESIYPVTGRILVLIGEAPWNGAPGDLSGTLRTIESFSDSEKKLSVIRGSWATETEQRNAGLEMLAAQGVPYCFAVDADEIYDPAQLHRMMQLAVSRPEISCWRVTMFTYWRSFRFRIDPPEQYMPAIFLRVGTARFADKREVAAPTQAALPVQLGLCHHMSYARTDEQIYRKITTFSHVSEMVPGWYENIWLRWPENPAMENIHPCWPGAYRRAVPQRYEFLPPVLKRLWDQG